MIVFFYCAFRLLKAMRNNLLKSQPKAPKHTRDLTLNGFQFGWKQIVDLYNAVKESINDGSVNPLRSLTYPVAHPDRFSKMGVKAAMVPF
jgi:hypothetical protein